MEQANANVARYDEADDNNVASVMANVGDANVSYDPSEQSILASNKSSLDDDSYLVVGDSIGDITDNGLSGSSDMNTAAAAAAAKIAEAKAAQATAEFPAANAAAGQNLQRASFVPLSPISTSTPSPAPACGSSRAKLIQKPQRDAQKNSQGLYQCTWPDCTEKTQQFERKSGYDKHMDKHERPYRCTVNGCEKLPGLTYSGGLLRHEREVHGMYGGPRKIYCPDQTCKRSSVKPFSRQENLNDHKLRVHNFSRSNAAAATDANNNTAVAAADAAASLTSTLSDDHGKATESLDVPRGRKRTASSLIGDAKSVVNDAYLRDYHNDHSSSSSHDLREKRKRVRLDMEQQHELQNSPIMATEQQIMAMGQQIMAMGQQIMAMRQQIKALQQRNQSQPGQQQHELDDVLGSTLSPRAEDNNSSASTQSPLSPP